MALDANTDIIAILYKAMKAKKYQTALLCLFAILYNICNRLTNQLTIYIIIPEGTRQNPIFEYVITA